MAEQSDSADDLRKYLQEDERESSSKTDDAKEETRGGVGTLVIGVCLSVLGVTLTSNSSEWVYFGCIWAGTSLVLEGLYCLLCGIPQGSIPKAVRITFGTVGCIVSVVYAGVNL